MKIFNKGQRRFDLANVSVIPNKWTEVEDAKAEQLLKDFPLEITCTPQDSNAALQIEELKKELESLKATLALPKDSSVEPESVEVDSPAKRGRPAKVKE